MNFALDALWWKLEHPQVRDLASLLTAPVLWHTPMELPHRDLMGETGFRYLLQLDAQPQTLEQYLQQAKPQSHRLGVYAEHLLAFWFSHAPHCRLLGQNVVLQAKPSSPTLGALDYVAQINDKLYHIELTCKYYAHRQAQPSSLRGIQAHDTLQSKADKLIKQLALSNHDLFGAWCEERGIDAQHIERASVVRGMGFWRESVVQKPINPHAWQGLYLENEEAWPHVEGCRYAPIASQRLLSPQRLAFAQTFESVPDAKQTSVWWAQLQQRPDGFWHEINRSMCLPDSVGNNTI